MLRWGLIGAGDIVRKRVAAALRETAGSRLAAVSRARGDLASSFADAVGADRWYADWRDLVADADIDAVYIATPVHLHAEQTIAAAEHGKHVLCEKPMALAAADCGRMIASCRVHGVRLGVAYYRRFYPAVVRIKTLLASGEIGRPVVAQVNAFERFNPAPGDPRHWFVESARGGGGPMMDFGCHRIEVLLNLFGPSAHVTGVMGKVIYDREVEDTAVAALQFANGPCASIAVTHAALERQDTFVVFGTEGSAHVGTLNGGDLRVVTAAGERREHHPPTSNLHAPLVDDFVRAIASGRAPAVSGEDGLRVAEIEEELYRVAARAGGLHSPGDLEI